MFNKKEWWSFVISALIIGFALGFNDKQETFVFSYWITNIFIFVVMTAIVIFFYQWVQKTIAKMNGFETEFKLWSIDTFHWGWWRGFMVKQEKDLPYTFNFFGREITIKSIPIGVIIALIVSVITNGYLFFLGIFHYDLLIKRRKRIGRKFSLVTGYDEAKIAVSGPLTCMVIMVIFALLNTNGVFNKMILVTSWIAVFNMIPFFQFDGGKIWNGSRILYIFSLAFILFMVLLVRFLDVVPLLFISLILALIISTIYFYKKYVK